MVLRDFLLDLGQFRGEDNSELYLEAKEAEQRRLVEARRERMKRIPGLEEIGEVRVSRGLRGGKGRS